MERVKIKHKRSRVPEYLLKNVERIINWTQKLPPWPRSYDALRQYRPAELLYCNYPDRLLQRTNVVSLFTGNDPVLAVVAAMIWGGIRANRLKEMLDMGEAELRRRLEGVKALVRQGLAREAFESLQPKGDHRINGLGPSYHTKILYFVGQAEPRKPAPPPLILDKWTKNAYFALLNQLNDGRDKRFFAMRLEGQNKDGIATRSNVAECYEAYIKDMDDWASELSRRRKTKIHSWQVEQFVFGRGRDKSDDNPRREILSMIRASL